MQKLNVKLALKLAAALVIVIVVGVALQKAIHKASLDRTLNDFKGKIITLDKTNAACDSKQAMRIWTYYESQMSYKNMYEATIGHCKLIGSDAGYKLKVLNAELLDKTHKVEDEILLEVTSPTSDVTSSGIYLRIYYNE